MNDDERKSWDRQIGEGSKAYHHFCIYRALGPNRSLRKMAKDGACGAKVGQLERWSSRWKWVDRCEAYDDYLQHEDRLRQEKERREMVSRHAKIAVLGQNLVVKGIENLLGLIEQGKKELSASDASRLLDVVVKVERLSRGEPTEISELGGSAERPLKLSIEERARQAVKKALGIGCSPPERVELESTEPESIKVQ
jgi:hypothetical protein